MIECDAGCAVGNRDFTYSDEAISVKESEHRAVVGMSVGTDLQAETKRKVEDGTEYSQTGRYGRSPVNSKIGSAFRPLSSSHKRISRLISSLQAEVANRCTQVLQDETLTIGYILRENSAVGISVDPLRDITLCAHAVACRVEDTVNFVPVLTGGFAYGNFSHLN